VNALLKPVRRDTSICANFGHAWDELLTLDRRVVCFCRNCEAVWEEEYFGQRTVLPVGYLTEEKP